MATVVLQAAGEKLLPGVGGIIGGLIGNYIDQKFLLPALFPQEPPAGSRIDSLQLSFASEGAPLARIFGNESPVTGVVIWISDFKEKKQNVGKGGGGGEPFYEYSIDIAIAYADGDDYPNGVQVPEQIFANGELIYDDNPNILIDDINSQLSVSVITIVTDAFTDYQMLVTSPNGGPDLSTLKSGKESTITGWSNSFNNGTFQTVRSTFDKATGVSTATFKNIAVVAEAAAAQTPQITQIIPKFATSKMDGIVFYPGDYNQNADPTIVAEEGAANISGFRGTAYCVISNLQLKDFGNAPPSTFTFIAKSDPVDLDLQTAVTRLLSHKKISSNFTFDATGIDNTEILYGFVVRQPRSTSKALSQLMIIFDLVVQDVGGVLTLFHRKDTVRTSISSGDLAAHELGDDAPRILEIDDSRFKDIPRGVTVKYLDRLAEYQFGSQVFQRLNSSSTAFLNFSADVVMNSDFAQCVARRLLFQQHGGAYKLKVQLPPKYLQYLENDVLQITGDDTITRDLRVLSIDRGFNELRVYEGLEDETAGLVFDEVDCDSDDPSIIRQDIYVPPVMELFVLDIPALTDNTVATRGFYWATATQDRDALFKDASLYETVDGGASFVFKQQATGQATMGRVTGTALGAPATVSVLDAANSVNVELWGDEDFTLESKTLIEVLSGANIAIIGHEILGFLDATLESDGTYTLTNLLRGLFDTDDEVTNQFPNSRFVLLTGDDVNFLDLPTSTYNSVRDYLSVAFAGVLTDFEIQVTNQTLTHQTLRPRAPYNVTASRDGSNNITLNWERRTRLSYNALSGNLLPQQEPNTNYSIDVLDMPGGTVLRTLTATSETVVYSAANQTTDGLTPGDPVDFEIFRVSDSVGRSKPEAVTL